MGKWAIVTWVFASLSAFGTSRNLLPDVSQIPTDTRERLEHALASGDEDRYQSLIHNHTLSELSLVYSSSHAREVETVYASFASDAPGHFERGDDEGFGLHVVKRLRLPRRTILVNEHWPADRVTGGLLLPDEIRVQSQVFAGEARVPGSHNTYLFDALRVAWGPDGEIEFYRRGHDTGGKQRVPVVAPTSCLGCHDSETSESFADVFRQPGEPRNFETIVSDSHFQLPYDKQRGFRQYVAFLESAGRDKKFIGAVAERLARPEESMRLAGIEIALTRAHNSLQFLGDDAPWARSSYSHIGQAPFQQGTYLTDNGWYLDALEEIFEGKYRWWFPQIVVP